MIYPTLLTAVKIFGAACVEKTFFGIKPWFTYLNKAGYFVQNGNSCDASPTLQFVKAGKLDLSVLSLVGLGILDILLRVAGLVAAGFIMYAGFQYLTAQGEPDKTKRALGTIINAAIGLGITIVAAGTVAFIGNRIGQ